MLYSGLLLSRYTSITLSRNLTANYLTFIPRLAI